ncbi:MAG: PspC domain-containing protein [Parvimonas micra]|uniref:PspC domain-containing protein n=1 Tax=Parvimonas micra TaxID=33033 RepID=A0A930H2X8_9FIRM|nr:PspC domain-containing protein [Parvimonas micra]MBF1306231.1 PspC domain-containing protein [Parvimonas micra]
MKKRVLFGVCELIGKLSGFPPILIRILFLSMIFAAPRFGLTLYVLGIVVRYLLYVVVFWDSKKVDLNDVQDGDIEFDEVSNPDEPIIIKERSLSTEAIKEVETI